MNKRAIVMLMLATLSIGGASLVLTACEENEGPAERLGEEIDEAVDEAKDRLK